jgi:hypothetical protein
MPPIADYGATKGELVLDMGGGTHSRSHFPLEFRQNDPIITPQPYQSPADYVGQYPTPVPTEEIIAMCEELSAWQAMPEHFGGLKTETWRELNSLAFTSGSSYISFADGECPEEYTHDGSNTTVTLKNIGAKKTLSISDILDSAAKIGMGQGIGRLIGGIPAGEGMPGGSQTTSFLEEVFTDVKGKEVRAALTLVLNGWDRLLVLGDVDSNSLEFDGIEQRLADPTCTPHSNDNSASGTFAAAGFDRFLSESCAKPTALFGAPQAVQELLSLYMQLGWQGSQIINFGDGNRIIPGFNFAGFVNTGIGRLPVVADANFTRTNIGGGNFQSKIYALRMNHNGTDLVYKRTQIPFSWYDLVPGCTAISFMVWAKTALVIKHCCAHGVYTSQFTGRITTTCPTIY